MEQELKTRKSASDFANDSTRNPCSAKFIRSEEPPTSDFTCRSVSSNKLYMLRKAFNAIFLSLIRKLQAMTDLR